VLPAAAGRGSNASSPVTFWSRASRGCASVSRTGSESTRRTSRAAGRPSNCVSPSYLAHSSVSRIHLCSPQSSSSSSRSIRRLLKTHCFQQAFGSPYSDSPNCLRFGHWLTLCTLNMHLLTYLLACLVVVVVVVGDETCFFHDCGRRRFLHHRTCVTNRRETTDARRMSVVTLDWSEIMTGYNTADSVVRDKRTK